MPPKPLTDEQRLILRLERAREEAPLSEAEAREFLGELGIDVDAEYKLLLESLRDRGESDRQQQFADATAAYEQFSSAPRNPRVARNPEQYRSRLQELRQKHPQMTALHSGLTHMSDADVASLVDQMEALEDEVGEE